MFSQCLVRPVLAALELSYSGLKCTMLIDNSRQVMSWSRKSSFAALRRLRLLHRERDGVRSDVAEVQVRREPRCPVFMRLVVTSRDSAPACGS